MQTHTAIDIALPTERESERVASRLGLCLSPPLVITLSGEIGAGKTTLVRALLRSLGIGTAIKSPTFSLVESYELPTMQFHHFDLYRIHDECELDYIGFRDYFTNHAICCIEWPERAPGYCDRIDLACSLVSKGAGREMTLCAYSERARRLLSCFEGEK